MFGCTHSTSQRPQHCFVKVNLQHAAPVMVNWTMHTTAVYSYYAQISIHTTCTQCGILSHVTWHKVIVLDLTSSLGLCFLCAYDIILIQYYLALNYFPHMHCYN